MARDRRLFSSYRKLKMTKPVRLGSNAIVQGIGVGDIDVKSHLPDNEVRELRLVNVLHVPDLRRNLFSVTAATNMGNVGSFTQGSLWLTTIEGTPLLVAHREGSLYHAALEEQVGEAAIIEAHEEATIAEASEEGNAAGAADDDELTVWHERFGHIHKRRLIAMAKARAVEGLDEIAGHQQAKPTTRCKVDCEACLVGKQARKHFGSSTRSRATAVDDRVYVDICGPILPSTVGGNNYFVLFKDEFSAYRHIYIVKSKSDAYDALRMCVGAYRG